MEFDTALPRGVKIKLHRVVVASSSAAIGATPFPHASVSTFESQRQDRTRTQLGLLHYSCAAVGPDVPVG